MRVFKPVIVVLLAYLGFTLMFHASVQALELPNIKRVVSTAEMELNQANGIYAQVGTVDLIVSKAGHSAFPTSIKLVIDGEVRDLQIANISPEDECGSLIIEAVGGSPDSMDHVILKDNTTADCIQNPVAEWSAEVSHIGFAGVPVGKMKMTGFPQPVFSKVIEL